MSPWKGRGAKWGAWLVPLFALGTQESLSAIPSASSSGAPVAIRGVAGGMALRVRLQKSVPTLQIHGLDLSVGGRIYPGRSEWRIRCADGLIRAALLGRKLGEESTDPETAGAAPARAVVSLGERAYFETPAGFLQLNRTPIRESVQLVARAKGCDVVNALDMEKYLDSVANSEFSAEWSREALEAQIVAARTYALFQAVQARDAGKDYDVESTISDQVYGGVKAEHPLAAQAVNRTRGQILAVREGGSWVPLKAYYHSTCGGETVSPSHVWKSERAGDEHHQGVKCGYCKKSPTFFWKAEYGAGELEERIRTGLQRLRKGLVLKGDLRSIEPRARNRVTGRVERVAIQFGATWTDVDAAQFRMWIGPEKLRSTVFEVAVKPRDENGQKVYGFFGRGYGHGVGLCQYGAKGMGEAGFKSPQILSRYYPEARIVRAW